MPTYVLVARCAAARPGHAVAPLFPPLPLIRASPPSFFLPTAPQQLLACLASLRRGDLALNDPWAVTIQRTLDYSQWQQEVLPEALRARSKWVYGQMVEGKALPPCQRYAPMLRRSPDSDALPLQ